MFMREFVLGQVRLDGRLFGANLMVFEISKCSSLRYSWSIFGLLTLKFWLVKLT